MKTNFIKLSIIFMTILMMFNACSNRPHDSKIIIRDISTQAAYQLISENENSKSFKILDVRTSAEYKRGAIENAINLNYNSSDFEEQLEKLDKTSTYLIYCQYGGRSKRALEIMEELGFQKAYNLSEGIIGWEAAGYSITGEK